MKIALLFYGQPRFVDNEEVENTYKRDIINKYDTDIFCHMWWQDGDDNQYDCSTWSKIDRCTMLPNAKEIVQQKYSPKLLIHDRPRHFDLSSKAKDFIDNKFTGKGGKEAIHRNKNNYSNILSQLFSIQTIANKFDNYRGTQNYDWVILARYDTVIRNLPDLNHSDSNKFYVSNIHHRFPDLIQCFGTKFLSWAKNVYTDTNSVYSSIWEPSPEAFKMKSFLSRFPESDIHPCSMNATAIRG